MRLPNSHRATATSDPPSGEDDNSSQFSNLSHCGTDGNNFDNDKKHNTNHYSKMEDNPQGICQYKQS